MADLTDAELDRLRAALDKWESTLSAVMPADYKDWHQSDRSAWPDLAASCIVNARRMAEADGVLINAMDAWRAAVEAELNTIHDTADSYPTPQAAIRALIEWHCAVQIDPAVSSDAAALVERGRKEAAAWRPIETAPKEHGSHVLLHGDGDDFTDCTVVGFWSESHELWLAFETLMPLTPTHYMPLPDAPQQTIGDNHA